MRNKATENATLLIVNREPQAIAGALFDAHQFRVETLLRADALFEHIHALQPDLILLGLAVPGANSFKLCKQLKKNAETSFLPVIMTGIHSSQEATASLDAGADDMLLEPPHPGEVVARVRSMLRLKRQYDDLLHENRQLAERLVIQNQELAEALREVNTARLLSEGIVNNLSHELRTPLLQVKSAVATLRSDGRAGGAELMDTLIDYAVAATARLEGVVSNLTQLASATQPKKREPFRVQDAVTSLLRQLNRQWASSDAVARIQLYVSDAPLVIGDRNGVVQVLQQLLDNALKFSPNGGPVEVIAEPYEDQVWIAVRDHGIGIAQENLEHIFKAFYQIDSSSRRTYGGAGVGLAIVKLILDGLDTRIQVDTELGVGSTFGFMLPRAHL